MIKSLNLYNIYYVHNRLSNDHYTRGGGSVQQRRAAIKITGLKVYAFLMMEDLMKATHLTKWK